mmetsp:Transcript_61373/g.136725  ORF Transcript_61373/g.136725 Transcript_61373/m.136725 type:complete len:210 (+) Transcript_61373:1699-2328(+)
MQLGAPDVVNLIVECLVVLFVAHHVLDLGVELKALPLHLSLALVEERVLPVAGVLAIRVQPVRLTRTELGSSELIRAYDNVSGPGRGAHKARVSPHKATRAVHVDHDASDVQPLELLQKLQLGVAPVDPCPRHLLDMSDHPDVVPVLRCGVDLRKSLGRHNTLGVFPLELPLPGDDAAQLPVAARPHCLRPVVVVEVGLEPKRFGRDLR